MDGLLMDTVLKALGYRYKLVIPANGEWGFLKDRNWTGMIGEVVNNQADLVWTLLSSAVERYKVVDCSNVYDSEGVTFAVAIPDPTPTAYIVFSAFDLPSWISIFVIMILMSMTMLIIRARHSKFFYLPPMAFNLNNIPDVQLIRVAVIPVKTVMDIIIKETGKISVSRMDGLLMDAVLTALGYRYELVIPTDGEKGQQKHGNWTGIIEVLIRVAVVLDENDIDNVKYGDFQISMSGIHPLLIDAILKALGYKYELQIPDDGHVNHLKDGNWTGIIGEAVNNRADLAWWWLTPTEERHRVVDFSNIYHSVPITFGVTKPYPIPTPYAMFYAFDLAGWIGIFANMILLPLLLLVLGAKYSYLELFLQILGSILKQPLTINMNSKKILILLVFWLIFSLLISCFYSSVLLSILTKPFTPKAVTNFRELSDAVSKGLAECYMSKDSIALTFLLNSEEKYLKTLGETVERNSWNTIDFDGIPLKTTRNIAIINTETFLRMQPKADSTHLERVSPSLRTISFEENIKEYFCEIPDGLKLKKSSNNPLMRVVVYPLKDDTDVVTNEDGQISVSGMEGLFMDAVLTVIGYRYKLVIPTDGECGCLKYCYVHWWWGGRLKKGSSESWKLDWNDWRNCEQ
ncbi:Glutamate receptor ionotropic like protein [Argiope bruennichi]|uniref:Glutamate receptor ionotropic like protein n=1 Tax=Argiope bruennichi TaxID=94029 RepID=A0A8T0E822_ARGBR|nr:Glutamate receptor ionotropic like protein [Argiope bruennichi]